MKENFNLKSIDSEGIPKIIKLAEVIWPATYEEILSHDQIDYMMNLMYIPRKL